MRVAGTRRASIESTNKQVSVDEKSSYEVSALEHGPSGAYKTAFPNVDEKALKRKIDMRVVPFIFILNFFTFLYR